MAPDEVSNLQTMKNALAVNTSFGENRVSQRPVNPQHNDPIGYRFVEYTRSTIEPAQTAGKHLRLYDILLT